MIIQCTYSTTNFLMQKKRNAWQMTIEKQSFMKQKNSKYYINIASLEIYMDEIKRNMRNKYLARYFNFNILVIVIVVVVYCFTPCVYISCCVNYLFTFFFIR